MSTISVRIPEVSPVLFVRDNGERVHFFVDGQDLHPRNHLVILKVLRTGGERSNSHHPRPISSSLRVAPRNRNCISAIGATKRRSWTINGSIIGLRAVVYRRRRVGEDSLKPLSWTANQGLRTP